MSSLFPTSVDEANKLLEGIGLPPLAGDQFSFLVDTEGDRFKAALVSQSQEYQSKSPEAQYLASVLSPMSPGVIAVVRSMGYDPTDYYSLVPISKAEGKAFRRAMRAVGEGKDMDGCLRLYLEQLFQNALPRDQGGSIWDRLGEQESPLAPTPAPRNADSPSVPLQGAPDRRSGAAGSTASPAKPKPREERPCSSDAAPAIQSVARSSNNVAGGGSVNPRIQAETPASPSVANPEECVGNRYPLSAHFYGARAAVCVTPTVSRSMRPTLSLEFAKAVRPQTYDWKDKVAIQLTPGEIALFYGVLIGHAQKATFHHVGAEAKTLVVANQVQHFHFELSSSGGKRGVQLIPTDLYLVLGIVLKQLLAACPGLSEEAVLSMVKRVCDMQCAAEADGSRVAAA